MDVHAPHEPIHSLKDFLLHLVTITVGLLIAVGIEGCVALHHEHKLVAEARATLREEIEHNLEHMQSEIPVLKTQKEAIARNIKILTRIELNPKDKEAQNANLDNNFRILTLHDAAWKTAQISGALAYMPYSEAERYSDIYLAQDQFIGLQNKVIEDAAQFLGTAAEAHMGEGDLTSDQAAASLRQFGVWQAHLLYLDLLARLTVMEDQAFLKGKDAPKELREDPIVR